MRYKPTPSAEALKKLLAAERIDFYIKNQKELKTLKEVKELLLAVCDHLGLTCDQLMRNR